VQPSTNAQTRTLADLRNSAGYTQAEVAQHVNQFANANGHRGAGVSANTVSRWERGESIPTPLYTRALAAFYNVTVEEIRVTLASATTARPARRDARPRHYLDQDTEPAVDDPRVVASQDEWRRVRRDLNTHREALTHLAASTYPATAQFGDTGLIAGPGWVPDAPIPLAAIQLHHDASAQPLVDGSEPASAHVRPLAGLARPYHRYTAAIRDLDAPRLFDNRYTWRLAGLDWSQPRMDFGDTTYFATMDICEALAHEMAYVHLGDQGELTGRRANLRDLPLRRLVGDPFDLTRRAAIPAISTLTIRGGDDPTFLLHRRDSKHVAIAGGMLHVIPSGVFQPSSVEPACATADFDLFRNLMREYSEELLGMPEANGDGCAIDYAAGPFAEMTAARDAGKLRVDLLGVALDALTLAAEVMTVCVIDPEVFDVWAADFVSANDEGTIVNQRLAFDEATITEVLNSGRIAPAAAGCLTLAWKHRDHILGGSA